MLHIFFITNARRNRASMRKKMDRKYMTQFYTCNIGALDKEWTLRFFKEAIASHKLTLLPKKSVMIGQVKKDARNCSTVIDQSGSVATGLLLDWLPL